MNESPHCMASLKKKFDGFPAGVSSCSRNEKQL